MKIYWLIFQEWLKGSYSNLEWGLPCIETNSSVNLALFGLDITELQMRENRDFVVPVNILTPLTHAPFSWATWNTTVCLDACKELHMGGLKLKKSSLYMGIQASLFYIEYL